MSTRRARTAILTILVFGLVVPGCGSGGGGGPATGPTTVRLGYFPNLTHATAIVGVAEGIFQEHLGADRLEVSTFNAGPAVVEALFSEGLDAAYIGPNPAINAFAQSDGRAVRIIAGATSGGASLVVGPGIAVAEDLRGQRVASPQLGGTQDVALRHWLLDHRLRTDTQGGGEVSILPQENAQTLDTFRSGEIQAAWVPEPWATRLVQEAGGTVLVDESTLWPRGRFVTTHLIVRTRFLEEHPDAVRRLLEGHVQADDLVNRNPAEAQRVVNAGIEAITGKKLPDQVIAAAWKHLAFTVDPVAASLSTAAAHAAAVGLLDEVDLSGIYAVELLNEVLRTAGRATVAVS
ncbi:MAG: aliphatic sulfonate ABC transporter substrate-binding protein [Acidimicrobiales bacterium]